MRVGYSTLVASLTMPLRTTAAPGTCDGSQHTGVRGSVTSFLRCADVVKETLRLLHDASLVLSHEPAVVCPLVVRIFAQALRIAATKWRSCGSASVSYALHCLVVECSLNLLPNIRIATNDSFVSSRGSRLEKLPGGRREGRYHFPNSR